ncbi:MAG TPA: amino acid permease [Caulobacteraceae bacterium]|nr:amino acid permease [Caulobacteraceae bacterium]
MANASVLGRVFQRKPVELIQAETRHTELKRSLGALNLILLGIGCIIGTGIFVLTGHAAAEWAGPGIMISFVITGVLCGLVALCYAELASALPVSGSAYSYSYASTGEIVAWIMGVLLLLEYGLAASTVAVGWSGYLVSLLQDLHINIPVALQGAWGSPVKDSVTGAVIGHGVVNLPAVIGVAAVTTLLIVGVSESATANNIIVAIKVTVVVAFIAIGAFYVKTSLWSPLIPAQVPAPPPGAATDIWHQIGAALLDIVTGKKSAHFGVVGVIHGAAQIFFAYIGFEAVSTAGAESKNPARDMPIGILGSLIICTLLYIATCAVLVGIVPYAQLDGPAPIAYAVNHIGITWFAELVKLGAIAGLTSVMLVLLYGQTRIFYTMSHDGLLPSPLAAVHKRFKTPWINTIIVGVAAASCAGFLSLETLSDVTNVGTLAAFTIVCGTVIYLRITHKSMARPFRTPLYPVVPILGIVMCVILLMSLMAVPATKHFFLIYMAGGVVVYFLYGLWNSKLGRGLATAPDALAPMAAPHPEP